jgi:septal ring factor EnvC (AmiA/AmiB activator)
MTASIAAATDGTKMKKTHKEILEMILKDIPCDMSRSWHMRNNYGDYLVKDVFVAIQDLLSAEQAKTKAAKEDVRSARRERDEHRAELEKLRSWYDTASQHVSEVDHRIETLYDEIAELKHKAAADAEEIKKLKMTEQLWYGQSQTIQKDMQANGWEGFKSHPVDAVVILLHRIRKLRVDKEVQS